MIREQAWLKPALYLLSVLLRLGFLALVFCESEVDPFPRPALF